MGGIKDSLDAFSTEGMSGHYSIQGGDGKAPLEGYRGPGKSSLYGIDYCILWEGIERHMVTSTPGI